MKAITIRQPHASLIAAGVKTIETRPRSTSYRGRIAIHAAKGERSEEAAIVALPAFHDALWPHLGFTDRPMPAAVRARLPRGAVVASAVLTDCVPIGRCHDPYASEVPDFAVAVHWEGDRAWHVVGDTAADITDQLPYGDFSPGRWALLLDDIKPTTARCPWCWTARDKAEWVGATWLNCRLCDGGGHCDPVPARGQQAVPWEWKA